MNTSNRLRLLVHIALLTALEIVLNRFCSINTTGLKIGFSFVPIALCAMLYGSAPAAVCYALADFLGAILFPTGSYHPGFTVSCAAMGAVYGLLLNRKSLGFLRYLIPTLINCLIIGLFVNSLWIAMLYGSRTYWGWVIYRCVQELVLIPVNLALLPALERLAVLLKKVI